jgi:hypothetical protein
MTIVTLAVSPFYRVISTVPGRWLGYYGSAIHTASPLTIRETVCDAAEHELDYAIAVTHEENRFLDRFLLFQHIKKNADMTLRILGQPPYFHVPTV